MQGIKTSLCTYISRVVDARLSAKTSDASSVSNSFNFLEEKNGTGLLFILRYPSELALDSKTYYELYQTIAPAISSVRTLIRTLTFQLVTIDEMPLEMSQGFFFPWRIGRAKRIVGFSEEIFSTYNFDKSIPLMDGMEVARRATTYLITGNTGSGKTEAFKYLVRTFSKTKNLSKTKNAQIIIFDAKKGATSRWAKRNNPNIELVLPQDGDRPEDYIPRCNAKLSEIITEMNSRQNMLFEGNTKISTTAEDLDVAPIWVCFEEIEALTLGMSPRSTQVQDLYRLLTQIALLGRESLVGLMITSQIARNDVIPIPIRSQMLVKILLGIIDSNSTTYLFGDLTEDIPLPLGGPGSGIVSINDGEHFGIEPIEMPTILEDLQ